MDGLTDAALGDDDENGRRRRRKEIPDPILKQVSLL